MFIVFNCLNSGLANNGGSRTVILCAETIEKLGYDCSISATKDIFDWFNHKSVVADIPNNADVVIATACTTVDSTIRSNVPIKAWYIRGHETWMYDEGKLRDLYNSGLKNIVNSNGLKDLLLEFGAPATVIYPGIDDHLWHDRKARSSGKIRIGCLYQKKPTKRWSDFVALSKILGNDDYEYIAFGAEPRKDSFLSYYKCNASISDLNGLYNSCHIWFAPTVLEGLHNVPIEASLCGCLLVCNDAPMNGMCKDYAFDGKTAMVYRSGDVEQAANCIKNADWTLVENMKKFLTNDMGNRRRNMQKFVKYMEDV